jgi:hypothetical protein
MRLVELNGRNSGTARDGTEEANGSIVSTLRQVGLGVDPGLAEYAGAACNAIGSHIGGTLPAEMGLAGYYTEQRACKAVVLGGTYGLYDG